MHTHARGLAERGKEQTNTLKQKKPQKQNKKQFENAFFHFVDSFLVCSFILFYLIGILLSEYLWLCVCAHAVSICWSCQKRMAKSKQASKRNSQKWVLHIRRTECSFLLLLRRFDCARPHKWTDIMDMDCLWVSECSPDCIIALLAETRFAFIWYALGLRMICSEWIKEHGHTVSNRGIEHEKKPGACFVRCKNRQRTEREKQQIFTQTKRPNAKKT